jgi:hypothetical protein
LPGSLHHFLLPLIGFPLAFEHRIASTASLLVASV